MTAGKPQPPTQEQLDRASAAMRTVAVKYGAEADAIAEYLDAQNEWLANVESMLVAFSVNAARAAGFSGKATGEEVIARIKELRLRAENQ